MACSTPWITSAKTGECLIRKKNDALLVVREIRVLMCTVFHRAMPKASTAAGVLLHSLWSDKIIQSFLKKVRASVSALHLTMRLHLSPASDCYATSLTNKIKLLYVLSFFSLSHSDTKPSLICLLFQAEAYSHYQSYLKNLRSLFFFATGQAIDPCSISHSNEFKFDWSNAS